MSSGRFNRERKSSKAGYENDKSDDSQSRTITPTSSQEDVKSRPAPTRQKSWSTKSANARKPWLGGATAEGSETNSKPMRKTVAADEHVLHTPRMSPKLGENLQLEQPAQSFDDLWDESVHANATARKEDPARTTANAPPALSKPVTSPASAPTPNLTKKKSEKKTEKIKPVKELDTNKFSKGSKAPPNTPVDPIHATAETTLTGTSLERKKNPIKHPRKSSSKRTSKRKDGSKEEKDKESSKGKNKDVVTLEKQLDRVTFLQKRQFDQLSSLKKMLLASRNKEKESVKVSEEWKTKADENNSKIELLEKQLDQTQSELHLSKQKLKRAQSATAAVAVGGASTAVAFGGMGASKADQMETELIEKDAKIAHMEQQMQELESKTQEEIDAKEAEAAAQLQTKQDKIAELEQRLQDIESGHTQATEQVQNSLEIAESKLRKKTDQAARTHEEMEELREQLTSANASIEQLEEERNYSRAKMSELNDMVSSKGGISDAEKVLLDRAAEISNLQAKLNATDGKVQDRDGKIFKMKEEISGINDLVKQLSDAFVGEDDDLKKNQELLLESSTSSNQSSSLLLMTMMNMLDATKTKMTTLQKERDDMNAKAADRGIQLAESHIRVDKLRTELRRMRAERERGRGGRGGRGGGTPNPNDPRRGPSQNGSDRPRHASHTNAPPPRKGSNGNFQATPGTLNNQSERDRLSISTRTAPPTPSAPVPKPSRFMNFLKGNLTQEVGPETEKTAKDQNSPPVVVHT